MFIVYPLFSGLVSGLHIKSRSSLDPVIFIEFSRLKCEYSPRTKMVDEESGETEC